MPDSDFIAALAEMGITTSVSNPGDGVSVHVDGSDASSPSNIGGDVRLKGGAGGKGGAVRLTGGAGSVNPGGGVSLTGGDGDGASGGEAMLSGGFSTGAGKVGGNAMIDGGGGEDGATNGFVLLGSLTPLPTSDPSVASALYGFEDPNDPGSYFLKYRPA